METREGPPSLSPGNPQGLSGEEGDPAIQKAPAGEGPPASERNTAGEGTLTTQEGSEEEVPEWYVFLPPDALRFLQREHERQQQQQQQQDNAQQQPQEQMEEQQQQQQGDSKTETPAESTASTEYKRTVSGGEADDPSGDNNNKSSSNSSDGSSSSSSSSSSGIPPEEDGAGDEGGVVGPLTVSGLGAYFAWNLIDGLTYVLRQGDTQWAPICECPAVAAALRGWQQQQQQQEEEAAAFAAKAEVAAEAEAAAAFAAAAAAAVPGKKRRAATEKAATLAVAGAVAAAAANRAPFPHVDAALKYCGPDGQWMVFDTVDKLWRSKHDYDFLVATAADAGGGPKPSDEALVLAAVAAAVKKPTAAAAVAAAAAGGEGKGPQGVGGSSPVAGATGGRPLDSGAEETVAETAEERQAQQKRLENAEKRRAYRERRKRKREEGLFIPPKKNPNVYVSGLPLSFTETDVAELFKKAGIFKVDPETLQPKIRLYADEEGRFKGDCLVSFVHEASVETAVKYFDGFQLTDKNVIKVTRADFSKKQQQKALSPPQPSTASGPQQAARLRQRKRVLAARQEQARLLSWDTEMTDGRAKRNIVVLRPMYTLEEAEKHEEGDAFYEELRHEVAEEVAKISVPDKVTVIPRHPQGVVCIKFRRTEDAQAVIEKMRGRVFDGRVVEAFFFDGTTDFRASCLPPRQKQHSTPSAKGQKTTTEVPPGVAVEETNLERFGEWVEEQSSDEEFEIQTEE